MNSFQYNAVDNQAISKAIPKHADLIERDQRWEGKKFDMRA